MICILLLNTDTSFAESRCTTQPYISDAGAAYISITNLEEISFSTIALNEETTIIHQGLILTAFLGQKEYFINNVEFHAETDALIVKNSDFFIQKDVLHNMGIKFTSLSEGNLELYLPEQIIETASPAPESTLDENINTEIDSTLIEQNDPDPTESSDETGNIFPESIMNTAVDMHQDESGLTITFSEQFKASNTYESFILESPTRLVIDIPGADSTHLDKKTLLMKNKKIEIAKIGQVEPTVFRVVLEMDDVVQRILDVQQSSSTVIQQNSLFQYQVSFQKNTLVIEFDPETEDASTIEAQTTPSGPVISGKYLIVIDPGHGGKDPGATSLSGIFEKDVNLSVATLLEKELRNVGIETYMTRTDDTFVELSDRSEISNKLNPTLFLSIHANAHEDHSKKGAEAFYYSSSESKFAAETIYNEYLDKIQFFDDRGVKEDNLYVLRTTSNTSVLFELGFLTNPEDEKILTNHNYHIFLASYIKDGILKYLNSK